MDIKHFEKWDLTPDDFTVQTYEIKTGANSYKNGVTVGITPYDICVSCGSQKSEKANLQECLNMLDTILACYVLK